MKTKLVVGILAILAILTGVVLLSLSEKNGGWLSTRTSSATNVDTATDTSTPTYTPTSTSTSTASPTIPFTPTSTPTLTATPILMCTPPPCAIGTSEAYTCSSGDCPGGCGTTCAAYTPTP